MLPFKKGPFYLAQETGAPCIPVSIWGTEAMMSKGSLRIRPAASIREACTHASTKKPTSSGALLAQTQFGFGTMSSDGRSPL